MNQRTYEPVAHVVVDDAARAVGYFPSELQCGRLWSRLRTSVWTRRSSVSILAARTSSRSQTQSPKNSLKRIRNILFKI